MPRRDGTGPMGMGSMTGRGAGYLRNSYQQNSVAMDEKTFLNQQETLLENQLKQVKDRLSELGKESE